jgi:hypothetical protein
VKGKCTASEEESGVLSGPVCESRLSVIRRCILNLHNLDSQRFYRMINGPMVYCVKNIQTGLYLCYYYYYFPPVLAFNGTASVV